MMRIERSGLQRKSTWPHPGMIAIWASGRRPKDLREVLLAGGVLVPRHDECRRLDRADLRRGATGVN